MNNTTNSSRRNFISNTTKAAVALGLAQTILPSIISAHTVKNDGVTDNFDSFSQKPLSYKFDSLELAIDKQTMEIHYTKHAATYCKNLNEAYISEVGTRHKTLYDILNKISKYTPKMRNNAGGHFNHEMFWQCLTPNTDVKPSDNLSRKINEDFGSLDNFKTQFTDAAKSRFGSGWVWLIKDKSGKLVIGSTPNQDNPLMNVSELKGTPLLCLDVWEHAYYLRYQNKRADYISNFWKVINWDFVNGNFEK